VKFGKYVALQSKVVFSSSLAIGLVLGILVLAFGGAEGAITLDIDISRSDSIWFLLGVPSILTLLFLIVTPISFLVHTLMPRTWTRRSSHDV